MSVEDLETVKYFLECVLNPVKTFCNGDKKCLYFYGGLGKTEFLNRIVEICSNAGVCMRDCYDIKLKIFPEIEGNYGNIRKYSSMDTIYFFTHLSSIPETPRSLFCDVICVGNKTPEQIRSEDAALAYRLVPILLN